MEVKTSRRDGAARRARAEHLLLGFAAVLLLLVCWHLVVGWMYSDVLPTPLQVVTALLNLVQGELPGSLLVSLKRIFIGYLMAVAVGLPLGLAIAMYPPVRHFFMPVIELLRPINAIAWIPMALIWFGVTETTAYFIVAYGSFFPILTNTVAGAGGVDRLYLQAAQTLGVRRSMVIREVVLPAALPLILAGLRIGLALGFAFVVAAELAVGFTLGSGLGYMLLKYSLFTIASDKLLANIFVLGVAGLLVDRLLRALQRRFTPWLPSSKT